ncbi:hypothetical protein C2L66_12265 [Paraburkholderia caribensis]|nr:hypothetical protein C2L66_12265 [Paraburkholderia caribensis]
MRSPSCLGVTPQSSALDLHGRPDDLHRRDLTLRFRVETGLANVLRKEAVAEPLPRRVEMTSDEACACQRDQWCPMCAACRCSAETFSHGARGQQSARKHTIVASKKEKGLGRAARCPNCCTCGLGGGDGRDTWIVSYVRTKLRTMSGETFQISRHTADCVANALQERFLSDTDAILKRILDLAALRYLRDGSGTVTLEDVRVALRSLRSPHR